MQFVPAVLRHLLILVGIEDFAALLTLDVLHFVFARYHAHLGMLADWLHDQFGGFWMVCRPRLLLLNRDRMQKIVPTAWEESMCQWRAMQSSFITIGADLYNILDFPETIPGGPSPDP